MIAKLPWLAAATCLLSAGQALAQPAPVAPASTAGSPRPGPAVIAPAPIVLGLQPEAPAAAPAAYRSIAPAGDIFATLQASGQFTVFLKAAAAANLITILKLQPNITVLAPTDAAFAALPPEQLAALMAPANVMQLQRLTYYHLINARVDSALIRGRPATPLPTVAGSPLTLGGPGPLLKANDATVVQADVPAANGLIHVIDKVLMPATVSAALARLPGSG
jgi:uncharacterized surface protein with fasciclin (FAS1) repeats